VAGSCEHGNEPLHSKKGGKFLDWLSDYYLLKNKKDGEMRKIMALTASDQSESNKVHPTHW
jgi:hypothetical protein